MPKFRKTGNNNKKCCFKLKVHYYERERETFLYIIFIPCRDSYFSETGLQKAAYTQFCKQIESEMRHRVYTRICRVCVCMYNNDGNDMSIFFSSSLSYSVVY